MKPRTALIEYEITTKYLYIFCWAQDELQVKRQLLPSGFKQQFNRLIYKGIVGLNRKKYATTAYQMYQLLLKPIVPHLQKYGIQNLLLIPDSQLLELPFETLLTAPTDYKKEYSTYPYLLQKYTVRYHYSVTLWDYQQKQSSQTPRTYQEEFIGFAPVYDQGQIEELTAVEKGATRDVNIGGKSYEALLYSEKEVKNIEADFAMLGKSAKTYLRMEANLSHFKKRLEQSSIKYLHIAAHSVLNDREKEFVGILFSPTQETSSGNTVDISDYQQVERVAFEMNNLDMVLYPNEVALFQMQSDLVFLSCCKSGVGKIMDGEGMLSINRSFFVCRCFQYHFHALQNL